MRNGRGGPRGDRVVEKESRRPCHLSGPPSSATRTLLESTDVHGITGSARRGSGASLRRPEIRRSPGPSPGPRANFRKYRFGDQCIPPNPGLESHRHSRRRAPYARRRAHRRLPAGQGVPPGWPQGRDRRPECGPPPNETGIQRVSCRGRTRYLRARRYDRSACNNNRSNLRIASDTRGDSE